MFNTIESLSPDPLLGIIEKFNKDPRPQKIDLGVGVYRNALNQTPVLNSVKRAEQFLLDHQQSKSYLGAAGDTQFARELLSLALGETHPCLQDRRIAALQTPGGCGALRVAAELIVRAKPQAKMWVSDPTWANHIPLLGGAGIKIEVYPYYDYEAKCIRFDALMETLKRADSGDLVLLHACCHNPCGADLSPEQWQQVVNLIAKRALVPFVDMAYQGFGQGLDDDAYGLRLVAKKLPEAAFAISCSKNFGLYRDRVGLVGFITESAKASQAVFSHLAQIVRGIYSMPPDHGAAVVGRILSDSALRKEWIVELSEMRQRIQAMRIGLVAGMSEKGFAERFAFVQHERGMFSFLGVEPQQVSHLAEHSGIYMADSSRINIAGLNENNLPYFCDALANLIR
ncbi:MAG: aspartate aminotransferase [Lentisphaeria bacterium]|jgi:aspartate aminotransferase